MTETAEWTEPAHDDVRRIMRETRTVAVVGAGLSLSAMGRFYARPSGLRGARARV